MARVVLIDDDASLLEVLTLAFQDDGHDVVATVEGTVGLRMVTERPPGVLVCDINMPDLDGFSICRKLRQQGASLPILLLTSRDNDVDETLGLELGADDYVTKPFSTRVLLARVEALLRRGKARNGVLGREEPRIVSGSIELLPDRMEVLCQGALVDVTVTEFRLLHCFVERPERVLSRLQLLEWIRDDGSVVADRIIDTYVRRLRKKLLAIDPSFDGIQTVVGAGYRWRVQQG